MKRSVLFAAAVFIVAFIASTASSIITTGTDNQAMDAIHTITDGYEPWFEPFWTPGSTVESILFAFQAAIGAFVIGHFLIPKADTSVTTNDN